MKHLAIIIINYNGLKHTRECLSSLKKLKWPGKTQVIVVDNGSKNNQAAAIKKQFSWVEVISNKINKGFAEGNNIGVSKAISAGSDLVMLLNNDTKVDPNLALRLSQALEKNQAQIAVPKIYFYPGSEFHSSRYQKKDLGKVIWYAGGKIDWDNVMGIHFQVDEVDSNQEDQIKTIEFATGCCLMIKREVIKNIGLFDPKYFLYLEDADFSIRAKQAGYKIIYVPQALLWHKNAESSGGSGSSLQDYYFTRNRLLFGMRFAPFKTKLALIRQGIKFIFSHQKLKKQAALDYFFHRFGQGNIFSFKKQ